jgi:hypothetical protein
MQKKKRSETQVEQSETQVEQSERFRAEVRRLADAGELSPTEADERFEKLTKHLLRPRE